MNDPEGRQSLLWHYTSINGLISIVQGGALWASSALFMNDTAEIKHGTELLLSGFKKLKSEGSRSQQAFERWAAFTEEASGRVLHTFIASSTRANDSIAMWQRYGESGGFSIGFDPSIPFVYKNPSFWDFECHWEPVLYNDAAVESELDRAVAKIDEQPGISGDRFQASLDLSLDELPFESLACRVKPQSFGDEGEHRLIVHAGDTSMQTIEYRPSKYGPVPFVALVPAEGRTTAARLPIREVVIGPTAYPKEAELGLRSLLQRYGYRSTEIRHTETTYR